MKNLKIKNKKRLLCIALIGGAMTFCTYVNPILGIERGVSNVYAEETEELSFYNGGYIVLSGQMKTVAEGQNVVLTVARSTNSEEPIPTEVDSKSYIAYMAETAAGSNGTWQFTFALEKSGKYRAYIGAANVDENQIIDFSYTDKSRFEYARGQLFGGSITDAEAGQIITDYAADFGIDDVVVNDTVSVAKLAKRESTADSFTYKNSEYILKKSNMITELNAGRAETIAEYRSVFEADGVKYEKYLTDDILNAITPKLSNKAFNSFAQFDTAARDAAIVSIVNSASVANVQELLKSYATDLGINVSKVTSECVTALIKSKPASITSITSFVNGYSSVTQPTPEKGNGGRGGGGVFINSDSDEQKAPTEENETIYVFDDIAQVDWAVEAITQLSYRGVLNGKENRIFAPNDHITREEFTKVITLGFKVNLAEGECDFEDVDENSWAYPYIRSAYVAGVVNGITDTIFGFGSNITREDLCVMTDRMINIGGFDLKASQDINFSDENQISDYAKESVHRLAAAGIVSGTGDGFKPKANATRAEAAKIVYLAMMKTNR